ncbi:MAG: hypothetical protein Q8L91_04580 [Polaromonas sp.]|nr:hypothetical protein [Polaromonas sp.]
MRSRHNTIRAVAIGIGLTLLVVTGTAAMMAAFSSSTPATDIYRRVAVAPEPAPLLATGQDSVLYQRMVLADGRVQWVLLDAPVTVAHNNTSALYAATTNPVSYTLVVKPVGLSKPVISCSRSAYGAYDIACNTMI